MASKCVALLLVVVCLVGVAVAETEYTLNNVACYDECMRNCKVWIALCKFACPFCAGNPRPYGKLNKFIFLKLVTFCPF